MSSDPPKQRLPRGFRRDSPYGPIVDEVNGVDASSMMNLLKLTVDERVQRNTVAARNIDTMLRRMRKK